MRINSNLDINQVKPHLNSSFGVCYANEEKRDMDLRERKGRKRREESCNYIIILKIKWKRGHRGNTIWTVAVVRESAETIRDGTHLESCYLEGALSNGGLLWPAFLFCLCLLITFSRTTLFSTCFQPWHSTLLWPRNTGTKWTWMNAPKTVGQKKYLFILKIVYIRYTVGSIRYRN